MDFKMKIIQQNKQQQHINTKKVTQMFKTLFKKHQKDKNIRMRKM